MENFYGINQKITNIIHELQQEKPLDYNIQDFKEQTEQDILDKEIQSKHIDLTNKSKEALLYILEKLMLKFLRKLKTKHRNSTHLIKKLELSIQDIDIAKIAQKDLKLKIMSFGKFFSIDVVNEKKTSFRYKNSKTALLADTFFKQNLHYDRDQIKQFNKIYKTYMKIYLVNVENVDFVNYLLYSILIGIMIYYPPSDKNELKHLEFNSIAVLFDTYEKIKNMMDQYFPNITIVIREKKKGKYNRYLTINDGKEIRIYLEVHHDNDSNTVIFLLHPLLEKDKLMAIDLLGTFNMSFEIAL